MVDSLPELRDGHIVMDHKDHEDLCQDPTDPTDPTDPRNPRDPGHTKVLYKTGLPPTR